MKNFNGLTVRIVNDDYSQLQIFVKIQTLKGLKKNRLGQVLYYNQTKKFSR